MLINKTAGAFLIALATAHCASDPLPYNSVFSKRLQIPVGKEEGQVQWTPFGEKDWVVTLGGFLASDSGELFLIEGRKGLIKVFDTGGTYLRKFIAPDAFQFFISNSTIYGYGVDGNCLVGLNEWDGKIFFKQKTPFGKNWDPYEMDDGKLFFSSEGFGIGQVRYFDTKRERFDANPNFKQYGNIELNQINSDLIEKGYEKIGRLGRFLLFRQIHLEEKKPCTYRIFAATEKGPDLIKYEMTFSEQDIGYIMPDIRWAFVQKRFIYTVGFKRTAGNKVQKKIIVTAIDLQKVFPALFSDALK